VKLVLNNSEKTYISIFNNLGQKVYTSNATFLKGTNQWRIKDAEKWSAGTYWFELRTESGKVLSQSFLKD
jgi:hypothetical protein